MIESDQLGIEDPLPINPSIRNPDDHIGWVFHWEIGNSLRGAISGFQCLSQNSIVEPVGRRLNNCEPTCAVYRLPPL